MTREPVGSREGSSQAHLFAFEEDFASNLRCIPMAVRFKLDLCGIKLSLRQWCHLSAEQRSHLLMQPCASGEQADVYRAAVQAALGADAQFTLLPLEAHPEWQNVSGVPEPLVAYAAAVGVAAPTLTQWQRLTPLQRFVLLKLSRAKHDNVNFLPALREFGILESL